MRDWKDFNPKNPPHDPVLLRQRTTENGRGFSGRTIPVLNGYEFELIEILNGDKGALFRFPPTSRDSGNDNLFDTIAVSFQDHQYSEA